MQEIPPRRGRVARCSLLSIGWCAGLMLTIVLSLNSLQASNNLFLTLFSDTNHFSYKYEQLMLMQATTDKLQEQTLDDQCIQHFADLVEKANESYDRLCNTFEHDEYISYKALKDFSCAVRKAYIYGYRMGLFARTVYPESNKPRVVDDAALIVSSLGSLIKTFAAALVGSAIYKGIKHFFVGHKTHEVKELKKQALELHSALFRNKLTRQTTFEKKIDLLERDADRHQARTEKKLASPTKAYNNSVEEYNKKLTQVKKKVMRLIESDAKKDDGQKKGLADKYGPLILLCEAVPLP